MRRDLHNRKITAEPSFLGSAVTDLMKRELIDAA